MRRILFYRLLSKRSPIDEFLDSLSSKQAQKVVWVLCLIEEMDNVPRQFFKKLVGTDEIWEVRVQSGNDLYRLLCFFDEGNVVVLTNAFAKKTQKTPPQEIALAQQRKADYLARK